MPLDFDQIRQLLVTVAQTDITELTLKSDDFELSVRKAVGLPNEPALPVVAAGSPSAPSITSPIPGSGTETVTRRIVDTTVVQSNAPSLLEQRLVEVTSPMVGTFYRAPAPGEASFVEVGDRIRPRQTVCIIEAMKLMNEIEAEVSGQVMEILVNNGEPVEFGQPLMRVNPD